MLICLYIAFETKNYGISVDLKQKRLPTEDLKILKDYSE